MTASPGIRMVPGYLMYSQSSWTRSFERWRDRLIVRRWRPLRIRRQQPFLPGVITSPRGIQGDR